MLKKPSSEWNDYVKKIVAIKKKSNREVLCTACWMILNYEQRSKHKAKFPSHTASILTSSQFASGTQFYQIAIKNNKVITKHDGAVLVIQPCLFDPKKGAEHMEMIEKLSREMHSNPTAPEQKKNQDGDATSSGIASTQNYSIVYSYDPVVPTKPLKFSKVNRNLDSLIDGISEFQVNLFAQLFSSDYCMGPSQNCFYNPCTTYLSFPEVARKSSDSCSSSCDITESCTAKESPYVVPMIKCFKTTKPSEENILNQEESKNEVNVEASKLLIAQGMPGLNTISSSF
ncbi:unnamed protein product [Moneuplotes crassus]|uniref:Uncharacterized protein n=1 Tax=Euplotes crassus TaxID=5936 RepID=A0AAD1XYM3_EUPCR|nr:unnamed protein product [Moneuplotes crassus]